MRSKKNALEKNTLEKNALEKICARKKNALEKNANVTLQIYHIERTNVWFAYLPFANVPLSSSKKINKKPLVVTQRHSADILSTSAKNRMKISKKFRVVEKNLVKFKNYQLN